MKIKLLLLFLVFWVPVKALAQIPDYTKQSVDDRPLANFAITKMDIAAIEAPKSFTVRKVKPISVDSESSILVASTDTDNVIPMNTPDVFDEAVYKNENGELVRVTPPNDNLVIEERYSVKINEDKDVRLFAKNRIILQLKENLSSEQISTLLAEERLTLLKTIPSLDTIIVHKELSNNSQAKQVNVDRKTVTNQDISDINVISKVNNITEAVRKLEDNPNIEIASPDFYLTPNTSQNEITVTQKKTPYSGKELAWWIEHLDADKFWGRMHNDIELAFIDSSFKEPSNFFVASADGNYSIKNSHGVLVRDLACKKHYDGDPIKGLLPSCVSKPYAIPNFQIPEGQQDVKTIARTHSANLTSGILDALGKVIDRTTTYNLNPDGKELYAISISLGSNWLEVIGDKDRLLSTVPTRDMEARAGLFKRSYDKLENRGVVTFLAAGNDSFDSKYDSEINLFAHRMGQKGKFGFVIVEAHDSQSNTLNDSNTGGHLSCPSPIVINGMIRPEPMEALSEEEKPIALQGTSLATPLCASSYSILASLRPKYTPNEIINCFMMNTELHNGAARVNILNAAKACPRKL